MEDDRLIREMLANSLGAMLPGVTVNKAEHGAMALELLSGGLRPDIILCDLLMPTMDGSRFCNAVAAVEAYRDLPIILVSSIDTKKIQHLLDLHNVRGHLRKPSPIAEVVKKVREFLPPPVEAAAAPPPPPPAEAAPVAAPAESPVEREPLLSPPAANHPTRAGGVRPGNWRSRVGRPGRRREHSS